MAPPYTALSAGRPRMSVCKGLEERRRWQGDGWDLSKDGGSPVWRSREGERVQSLTLSAHFLLNTCGRLIVSAETGRKPLRWRVLLFFYLIKNNRMHRPHITCTPLTIKQRQSWKMCERSCLKDGCRLWYTKYPPNVTTGVWEKV